jgi:GNAT superfamily N-acetyltransferase
MNKKMILKYVTSDDMPNLMRIVRQAKEIMKHHHSGQWQGSEPSEQTITHDIHQKQYYGLYVDNELVGGCALLPYEDDYHPLVSGQWLNTNPYMVIHRFVIDAEKHRQGFGLALLQSLEEVVQAHGIHNIRVDTHELNKPMHRLLIKAGYIQCGQALLKQAGLRVVYHKMIGEHDESNQVINK